MTSDHGIETRNGWNLMELEMTFMKEEMKACKRPLEDEYLLSEL